ncbi:hypothetical protein GTU79_19720 [Sodalis ligni]|uniref:RecE family exodeoxyribonuclease n=1 Tax=Sodalis ligni TaxID=2697027 RepID=UPI00193F2144|nr:RecE family exodeoxyribonuclease [Sodalis ligni]QWA09568.1 hypothetical protein GTU79_19720 [Sodalis ligni]
MPTYSFLIKGRAKSEKKSLFCWFESKSDSRAEREIMNILEDADIATGRGADYQLPVRIDFPVFDDLPVEYSLDETWFDRYDLAEDGRTCRKIMVMPAAPAVSAVPTVNDAPSVPEVPAFAQNMAVPQDESSAPAASRHIVTITAQDATFVQRVLGAWLYGAFTEIHTDQCVAITSLQHDMEATYPQNVLLALKNIPQLLHCFPETIFDLVDAIKTVWPASDKSPELAHLLSFATEWVNSHNNAHELNTGKVPTRDDITARWIEKQKTTAPVTPAYPAAPVPAAPKLDRPAGFPFTLDSLDIEIACALLPMDFDIHEIPGPIARRAKEMVANREEPWRQWSQKLRKVDGILDHSRETIFSLIRDAVPDVHLMPGSHQAWIDYRLSTESAINEVSNSVNTLLDSPVFTTDGPAAQPEVKNLGDGKFSVDGLAEPEREGPFYLKNPSTGKCRQIYNQVNLRTLLAMGYIEITFEEYLDVSFTGEVEEIESAPNAENTGNVQMEKTDSPEGENGFQLPAGESNDAQQEVPALPLIALDNLEHRIALVEKKLAYLGNIGIEFQHIELESFE